MKLLLTLLVTFSFSHAWSAKITSDIDSIDIGTESEPHLIMLSSGDVVFLDPGTERDQLLNELEESFQDSETLEFTIDDHRSLLTYRRVTIDQFKNENAHLPLTSLGPTPVTLTQSQKIFRNMRRGWQNNSQCYNRAHIWSYEEFKRSGVESMKLFLFFTSRYIRNYRYKWWFHVTPMVTLTDGTWRTLDKRYSRSPLKVKTWTDDFIYSRRSCPVVHRYSDYRNYQNAEDCYLIPVSQYYWQPRDIDRFERTGYEKTNFISSEINHAYWEAF